MPHTPLDAEDKHGTRQNPSPRSKCRNRKLTNKHTGI